jgi:hypothetical protein
MANHQNGMPKTMSFLHSISINATWHAIHGKWQLQFAIIQECRQASRNATCKRDRNENALSPGEIEYADLENGLTFYSLIQKFMRNPL